LWTGTTIESSGRADLTGGTAEDGVDDVSDTNDLSAPAASTRVTRPAQNRKACGLTSPCRALEHDAEKWEPVFGYHHAPSRVHDAEKWEPVFGYHHACSISDYVIVELYTVVTEPGTTNEMASGFVLCADDFALTEGVSRSILALLEQGKLSATGAMTNRPHWRRLAGELGRFSGKADLGLHLNLTCATPLGKMPRLAAGGELPKLGDLARAAATSPSARKEIAGEITRQLDAFEDALGRAPDFVDGHQHVHVLPGVRRAVLDAVARRYSAGAIYLRDPADAVGAIRARGVAVGKALTISTLALGFRGAALRRGMRVNRGFSGFVDDELARLDPVIATRPIEHAALAAFSPPAALPMVRFEVLR
jgi:predicted glycoside hydrolase/deacetylase ChbG (UPF0249 family)